MKIENARTLVTGASRGIGRAVALALAADGARVVGCARDAAKLDSLREESGGKVAVIAADLATAGEGERVAAHAIEELGGLDLLVNNAGVINEPGKVAEIPMAEWRRVLEVNVFGLLETLRVALPELEKSRGAAVNLSSYWGRHGASSFGPYCASKFAVEGISQAAAADHPNVTVVALGPGMVDTEMLGVAMLGGDTSSSPSPADAARRFVAFARALDASKSGVPCDL